MSSADKSDKEKARQCVIDTGLENKLNELDKGMDTELLKILYDDGVDLSGPHASPIHFAKALERAARTVGVNFIGGYSALVHKGFGTGDYALIESVPQALDETEMVCSSVNVGTTKAGINMDAVE